MRTLYVAAGGGGDAVGALLARRALGDTDERPALVSSCAWERLRIDPVPGPRARSDFTGLASVGGQSCEVTPSSDTVPPGRSVLPRLAETSGARIFLHDLDGGAIGLSDQLRRLSAALNVGKIVLIDVGGDVVARGPEQGLRSPLADSLTLSAALSTGIPTSVVVLGPGSDAELPETEVVGLLEKIGAETVGCVTPDDVRTLAPVLSWHPTEATALVAAGAGGVRGAVAMRRGRDPIPITDRTPQVWAASNPTFASFPLARFLQETTSLSEAEDVMRAKAVDEIDFERRVAADTSRRQTQRTLSQLISDMKASGATHLTNRRLSETFGDQVVIQAAACLGHLSAGLWSIEELVQAFPPEWTPLNTEEDEQRC